MYSKDHNINNPTKVDQIDLVPSYDAWSTPSIEYITQKEYDTIYKKDPLTIYVITDAIGKKVYYGDILVDDKQDGIKYFMGISNDGKYAIYLNERMSGVDNIIKICAYNDPQVALHALELYENSGSYESIDMKIYESLVHYIRNNISCHDVLIGILCACGFNNDYRLQTLIETAVQCDSIYGHDLSEQMKSVLGTYKNSDKNRFEIPPAYKVLNIKYSQLYDVLLKYNLFKDKEYTDNSYSLKLNLSSVIRDIRRVMR